MEIRELLLGLALVWLAAKVAGEGMERIGQTAVLGELLAGVLIGPGVLGLVHEGKGEFRLFLEDTVLPQIGGDGKEHLRLFAAVLSHLRKLEKAGGTLIHEVDGEIGGKGQIRWGEDKVTTFSRLQRSLGEIRREASRKAGQDGDGPTKPREH